MIESIHLSLIKEFLPKQRKLALCLGNQIPTSNFASAEELFKSLGFAEYIDVDYNGHAKRNCDLNNPAFLGPADLVYDGGVLEHVANIGQAFETLINSVAIAGTLIQAVPINAYGESYYGIDPMLQKDLFEANGFRTLKQLVYVRQNLFAEIYRRIGRFLPKPKCLVSAGKSLVFADNPKHIKICTSRPYPLRAHTVYVGFKFRCCVGMTWPKQKQYDESTFKKA